MPEHDSGLPRVTVVIPCHNHAHYIVEAITSITSQDYDGEVNIAVIDDGSTDNSWEIIKKFQHEEYRVSGLHNDMPTGPSSARNTLIKEMWDKTDLFCMLDADDFYKKDKIRKSVEVMQQDDRIGIVYSDAIIYNEKLKTEIREYREPFSRNRLMQECIISNTPMIRKRALEIAGLYDEGMRTAEDWDLWLRITQNFVAVHIPEALHYYRVTGQNSSDTVPEEVWVKNWQIIRNRHCK